MHENHFHQTKFNIAWISVLVIFLGTIIYPILLERAGDIRRERTEVMFVPVPQTQTPQVLPVNELPPSMTEVFPPAEESYTFTRNLKLGDKGPDVKMLQAYLNSRGFLVAESGPGSPGHESELFGKGTKEALIQFQEKYAEILLKPYGLTSGTGFFGEKTREFVNS